MNIRFLGHACFMVEINGKKILFDPFISPNEKASHIDITDLKPDYILISHGHEDHVADVMSIARQSEAMLVSNFEIVSWFEKQGIENNHPMNHGGSKVFDFGKVKYVNAIHSSVLPDGSYGGNPGGFVITSSEGNFYYAGDTALTSDMKLIPRWAKLDFAMLPIGDNFTMGIEDAVIASEFIQCDQIIGMHFDTFGYIEIDHNLARQQFNLSQKKLRIMEIGESITL